MFTAFARLQGPRARRRGSSARCAFPNSHGRPDHAGDHRRGPRAARSERFGVEDALAGGVRAVHPVGAGGHVQPRPAAGARTSGCRWSPDVEPYELMKLRLLNASHQALCYFGYLAGYRLVHEVCQDPLFAEFLLAYMDREATPTLHAVPGIDLHAYKRQLDRAVLQPRGARHRRPAVRRELGPHPEVAAAGDPAQPRAGGRDRPVGAGRGGLGAVRRGRRRAGRRRSRSSTGWPTR